MNNDDEEYLPNNERNQLMKKYYATMKVADKFWKIWQRDHLQSLRENQRVYLQNRKAVNDMRPQEKRWYINIR